MHREESYVNHVALAKIFTKKVQADCIKKGKYQHSKNLQGKAQTRLYEIFFREDTVLPTERAQGTSTLR
jgi:hypothetical protein